MASLGLAGTWGTQYSNKVEEAVDYTTTYSGMMSDEQLTSEWRKDMGSSYSRFRKKETTQTQPMILFTKSRREKEIEEARLVKMNEYTCPAPDRSLSQAPSRTSIRRMHTMDAPPAVGRSGMRPGKQRTDVAATGERYNNEGDPQRDSFINRSWMLRDDPALLYLRDGLPEAYMPNDVSLSVGNNPINDVKKGWHHGRKYEFTGDPMTKSGSRKAGVFMDEFDRHGNQILGLKEDW